MALRPCQGFAAAEVNHQRRGVFEFVAPIGDFGCIQRAPRKHCVDAGGIDDLVKRVIGLPGETVTARSNGGIDDVYINGRRLEEPYLPAGTSTTMTSVPPDCGQPPGGTPGCVVPPGRLLVLGDNRGDSKDGRFFGTITESSIVGRVFIKIWPLSHLGFM